MRLTTINQSIYCATVYLIRQGVCVLDVSMAGAAFAGVLSFLSPCILPIVPFYLSYMAGQAVHAVDGDSALSAAVRRKAVLGAIFFSAGILTIFVGLGMTATAFGQLIREWLDLLRYAAGLIIFLMGLHFLGVIRIGLLHRQFRADSVGGRGGWSLLGAYVVGLAFAFGWTPCVGPVLAAILFTAGAQETAGQGAAILFTAAGEESVSRGGALLLTYGLGMTLPFVLAALFIDPFMGWMRRFRRHLGLIEKAMGALLIVFAILIGTNTVNYIAQAMLSIAPDLGIIR